ncbi:MAG: YncE family protein [Alphaproteobacteria bacterium]|jgi:DNA-binding beta-propeller fold protein YncE|nr:YncE family protein [Alphaproteobacteria bacterium]MDP6516723.1 YncE family protein [Alphaproteobacteria bacterium]
MRYGWILMALALTATVASPAVAEMLAILNYETAAEESLESLQVQGGPEQRREGLAIVELDPESPDYGKFVADIPASPDLMLHHVFYNRDLSKAYVTALEQPILHVIDLNRFPYRLKPIPTPGCAVQEDIIFSDDNRTWYVTCMGSSNVVEGDAVSDTVRRLIDLPGAYPHGVAFDASIDRVVVTNCVAPDMSAAGHTLEIIEASTGAHLGGIQISRKKNSAPVEALFVPNADPPAVYVTNMMEDSLWAAVWNPATGTFDAKEVIDFAAHDTHMPLEMYFNRAGDRLYVTTAEPGHFSIFDLSNGPFKPRLLKQLTAAAGAHHVAITPDERTAYVQNALLNLPGLSDGSITVIDLEKMEVAGAITTFKDQGLSPNSITMLPEWYHPAGHFNNGPRD